MDPYNSFFQSGAWTQLVDILEFFQIEEITSSKYFTSIVFFRNGQLVVGEFMHWRVVCVDLVSVHLSAFCQMWGFDVWIQFTFYIEQANFALMYVRVDKWNTWNYWGFGYDNWIWCWWMGIGIFFVTCGMFHVNSN